MGHNPAASWAKVAESTEENFIHCGRKGFLTGENDSPDSTECCGEPFQFLAPWDVSRQEEQQVEREACPLRGPGCAGRGLHQKLFPQTIALTNKT